MHTDELLAGLRRNDLSGASADRFMERQVLLARLAEVEPETAFSYASGLPEDERGIAAVTALSVWANHDPQAAADYFETNGNDLGYLGESKRKAAGGLAGQWAIDAPQAALKWANSLSPDLSGDAAAAVIARWSAADPAAAASALNNLPEGFERTELIASLAKQQTLQDPQQAADWVLRIDPGGPEQIAAITEVMHSWLNHNPLAAAKWANSLPEGAAKAAAVSALPSMH